MGIKQLEKKNRLKTSHMPIISEKELKKNIKGLNIFALRTDSLSVKIVLGIFVINSLRLKYFFPNRDFFPLIFLFLTFVLPTKEMV